MRKYWRKALAYIATLSYIYTQTPKIYMLCVFMNKEIVFRGFPGGTAAAAAAKSLQSCPTLCDHIDDSPPGSPVSGILQVVLVVKNSPVNAEDITDEGLIPGLGRREKGREIYSTILAWRIPQREEPMGYSS